MAKITFVLLV